MTEKEAQTEEVPLLGVSRKFGKNESPWVSVFNMCNAAIGTGVLSFPYAYKQTGLLGGLLLTVLIYMIEVFALCILIRVAEKHQCPTYQELVRTLLGSKMAFVTSVVILIMLIGGNVSYFIITGDVFTSIFVDAFGENPVLGNQKLVMVLFGLIVILPLSLKTSLKALKYSSMLSVIMLSYLAVALISVGMVQIVRKGFPSDVLIFEVGLQAFITLDIVVFSFQSHIQVVPVFAELVEHPNPFFGARKDSLVQKFLDEESNSEIPRKGCRSERIKRMDGVIFVSMTICFILYTLVGEFGYLIFQDVESDVLKSFGNKNFFINLARVGMAVVAMVCYPVQHHPARSIVDDAVKHVAKLPATFSWTRHILITLGFFILTLGIALITSDLGKVFSIMGATGGVMVVFIVPGTLLFLGSHNASGARTDVPMIEEEAAALSKRSRSQLSTQVFGGSCIVVFGVIIFMATVYVTVMGQMEGSD